MNLDALFGQHCESRRQWLGLAVSAVGGALGLGGLPRPAAAGQPSTAADGDWPWWRGPGGDGRTAEPLPVTEWGPTKNVLWRTPVVGRGHSSPIVVGDRIILTTADQNSAKQLVLCLDRKTGKPLWNRAAHEGGFMKMHGKNSQASATPAYDGERIFSVFINREALHVTATDLDGKILWQRDVGAFTSEHGYGSSPVLHNSLVLIGGDNLTQSYVAGLDRATGKVVWRTRRHTTGRHGSYSTPIVANLAGRVQLVMSGMTGVASYDPETGEQLWTCQGPAEVTANTLACTDRLVFASGGFPEKEIIAIRADGKGDVTGSHVAWRSGKGVTYVPSPIVHDGHLYMVNDGGIATCFEAAGGATLWQGRLAGNFSASPVLADGLLAIPNEAGKTYVFKAGAKQQVVAENDLREPTFASPIVCRGAMYLRTEKHLYCIGRRGTA